jgi:hypothetical protein
MNINRQLKSVRGNNVYLIYGHIVLLVVASTL